MVRGLGVVLVLLLHLQYDKCCPYRSLLQATNNSEHNPLTWKHDSEVIIVACAHPASPPAYLSEDAHSIT